ncbi:hypothetical protein ACFS07_24725 [Undibacterium arcticum]
MQTVDIELIIRRLPVRQRLLSRHACGEALLMCKLQPCQPLLLIRQFGQ